LWIKLLIKKIILSSLFIFAYKKRSSIFILFYIHAILKFWLVSNSTCLENKAIYYLIFLRIFNLKFTQFKLALKHPISESISFRIVPFFSVLNGIKKLKRGKLIYFFRDSKWFHFEPINKAVLKRFFLKEKVI